MVSATPKWHGDFVHRNTRLPAIGVKQTASQCHTDPTAVGRTSAALVAYWWLWGLWLTCVFHYETWTSPKTTLTRLYFYGNWHVQKCNSCFSRSRVVENSLYSLVGDHFPPAISNNSLSLAWRSSPQEWLASFACHYCSAHAFWESPFCDVVPIQVAVSLQAHCGWFIHAAVFSKMLNLVLQTDG